MSSELFVKIRTEDLSDKVYERLKKAITMNLIKPGERIEMNTLSERWGVSRTPVKDAIARLTGEGLVEVRAKVGTYATRFTAKDMLELYAIRELLEGGSCAEMVRCATDAQIDSLAQIQQLLEEELAKDKADFDYFAFNHLDIAFHEQLIASVGNAKLLEVYRSLNFHTQVARYYYDQYEARAEQTIREHRAMIEAMRERSAEKFANIMRQHILAGKERLAMKAKEQEEGSHAL